MSLKINGRKKQIIKLAAWSLVGVLFVIVFVRVAIFEYHYYTDKEGSERAEQVVVETEELVEVAPTEEEVYEYTVAADRPRYLTIERLGIYQARILPMSINAKGELNTPNNIFDVGWYVNSGKPGQGGTMVIDGHNGGPHVIGVFKYLPDLVAGDLIVVERGDGAVFNYQVVENITVPLSDATNYMSTAMRSPEAGREAVTLISCTGEWSQSQGTYLSRQFTRAVLVNE